MRRQLIKMIIKFLKRILLFTILLIISLFMGQLIGYLFIQILKHLGLEDNLFKFLDLITGYNVKALSSGGDQIKTNF